MECMLTTSKTMDTSIVASIILTVASIELMLFLILVLIPTIIIIIFVITIITICFFIVADIDFRDKCYLVGRLLRKKGVIINHGSMSVTSDVFCY